MDIWILYKNRLAKRNFSRLGLTFLLDYWEFTEIKQIFIELILYQSLFLEDFIELLSNINNFNDLTFWQVELNIFEDCVYFRELFEEVVFIKLNIRMVLFLFLYLFLWNCLFLDFTDDRSAMFISLPLLSLDLFQVMTLYFWSDLFKLFPDVLYQCRLKMVDLFK